MTTGAVNPFVGSTAPTTVGPSQGSVIASGTSVTASSGTYVNLGSTNGGSLTLQPGVYVITGSFSNTGGTITGSNVTIVLTGTAAFSVSNGSSTTLTASAANGYAVYYASGDTQPFTEAGGVTLNITGAVYAPHSAASIVSMTLEGPLVVDTLSMASGGTTNILSGFTDVTQTPAGGIEGLVAVAVLAAGALVALTLLGRRRRLATVRIR